MKKIILLICLVFLCSAQSPCADNANIIKSVQNSLSNTNSRKDSIRYLYDLWDLSPRKEQIAIGKELFNVAGREGNRRVQHDVLRQMANLTRNDSLLSELQTMNSNLKHSEEQKETELFINIKRASVQSRYGDWQERQKRISEIIAMTDYDHLDKYGKVERLFTICEYLSNYAQGELLVQYLSDLKEIMEEADFKSYALENIYYSESANIFTMTGNRKKAIEADRRLLKIIDELEKDYRSKGRKYRNYNTARYIIFRRMLSNYSVLSNEEVNAIYNTILGLVGKDEEIKAEFFKNRRPSAYHAMKNKRYAEAIPYLESQINEEQSLPVKKQLYEMLMEATKATGDKLGYENASKGYENITQEYDSLQTETRYNELNVRYQVNMLKSENARLELEKRDNEIVSARRTMSYLIIIWVIFGVLLILMLLIWTRYRRTINNMALFVNSLTKERNELKRMRYTDSTPRGKKTTRTLPERKIDRNVSEMLNYILNDIMYIASIGQYEAGEFRSEVDAVEFMKNISDTLRAHSTKNINFDIKYPDTDFKLIVDKTCLTWLCEHILKVAVRLAPDGGTVGFECVRESKMVHFSFSHNGESLPDGKEDLIFENFITYHSMTNEKFAALKMCRMIHFLVDAQLIADRSINTGKLTLTIPVIARD